MIVSFHPAPTPERREGFVDDDLIQQEEGEATFLSDSSVLLKYSTHTHTHTLNLSPCWLDWRSSVTMSRCSSKEWRCSDWPVISGIGAEKRSDSCSFFGAGGRGRSQPSDDIIVVMRSSWDPVKPWELQQMKADGPDVLLLSLSSYSNMSQVRCFFFCFFRDGVKNHAAVWQCALSCVLLCQLRGMTDGRRQWRRRVRKRSRLGTTNWVGPDRPRARRSEWWRSAVRNLHCEGWLIRQDDESHDEHLVDADLNFDAQVSTPYTAAAAETCTSLSPSHLWPHPPPPIGTDTEEVLLPIYRKCEESE